MIGMEIRYFNIEGLFELMPRIFGDDRGTFLETYNKDRFLEWGLDLVFVQDNQSFSKKNVLRGIHFQRPPFEQGKLVRVIQGKALDVAVDLRPESPTFGKYQTCILDGELNNMFFIPAGFGHGFLSLTDVILSYKCTETYHRDSEGGIIWNDRDLDIDWGTDNPVISEKDKILPGFNSIQNTFAGIYQPDKNH